MAQTELGYYRHRIHNAEYLPLAEIDKAKNVTWVLGRINPFGTPSGSMNLVLDPDMGAYKTVPTAEGTRIFQCGTLQFLSVLSGAFEAPVQEAYRVEVPAGYYSNDPEDFLGSPFVDVNTAVFVLHPDKQGKDRYSDVLVIPDQWVDFVQPALNYYRRELVLHDSHYRDGKVSEVAARQLTSLLVNENPFIARIACSFLARANRLPSDWLVHEQKDPLRQAMMIDTVLGACPESKRAAYRQEVIAAVESAKNRTQLEGLLLGASMIMRHSDQADELFKSVKKHSLLTKQAEGNERLSPLLQSLFVDYDVKFSQPGTGGR